ncbi:DUF7507 domain-containing protein, partial [Romboutsia sp.]|uniref:DUF7507 domain-containing protein n=1 Tax=Romboutsia sp. TaxID=1965302 RepID=UPI003F3F5176
GNSNKVQTPVKQATIDNPDGGLVKSANPSAVKVGDVVTYTIKLTNTGNTTANNVFLSDTIPTGTTFVTVPNSVTVNGVIIPGADPNPPSSIPVGSIGPGATSTVTFNVVVNTIPASGTIPNDGTVNFDYIVDPRALPVPGSGNTNTAVIGVNQATIDYTNGGGMIKSFTPAAVKLGDVITYTVGLKNTGNATATSVTFSDTIPTGTTFVANSATVNGGAVAGTPNPPSSIPVGTIGPGAISTVTFKVTVVTLPASGTIPNDSTVNFKFTADPSVPNGATGGGNSNKVITPANEAIIDKANGGMVKSGSPSVVKLGDTLTYTVVLKNSGNTTAVNVVFTDTTPVGTINPVPAPPINVGDIGAGGTATVTFAVTVVSIPTGGTIPNDSTVNFVYTKDPNFPNQEAGSGNSNTLQTPVKQATIDYPNGGGMNKSVNPAFAKFGDTVTYTIGLKNTGNTPANNVYFSDTIPAGTIFVPNSVTVNGGAVAGTPNPPSSIPVGTINAGATSTVTFKVTVNTVPVGGDIPNDSTINFNYVVVPTAPPVPGSGNSNTATLPVHQATIDYTNGGGFVKSGSPSYAKVGDVITYTIGMKNTGNTTANNIIFTDTIAVGTTFVPNSATLNSIPQPGASPVPPVGMPVGSIGPGAISTVTFQVTVVSVPPTGTVPNTGTVKYDFTVDPLVPDGAKGSGNTNTINTPINEAIITTDTINVGFIKTASPSAVQLGGTVTYTISMKNTGNTQANNVILVDTIPPGTSFVANSATLNGAPQPGADPNPPGGMPVGNIAPGATSTVTFKIIVNTVPAGGTLPNAGTTNFTFTVNPNTPNDTVGAGNTNIVVIGVNQATIDYNNGGGMVKSVNPAYAKVGDTVTYTVGLKNTGNATANNVYFSDTIPSSTTFVANSVTVNNVPRPGATPNPPSSIPVGSIGPGAVSTVSFKVTILSIPVGGTIPNDSTVNFTFTADPSVPNGATGSGNSNTATLPVNQAIIDNRNGGGMVKSFSPAYVKVGDILTYTVGLTNTGNTAADNVVFTDTIPSGTTFVPNSVFVDLTNRLGESPQPPTGILVGTINAGATSTVTFQVVVNSVPVNGTIPNDSTVNFKFTRDPNLPDGEDGSGNSNTTQTPVKQATIDYNNGGGMVKIGNPSYVKVGDTLTYTIGMKNTGNTTANNVIFTDTIAAGTTFVTNSVILNGIAQIGANPDPNFPPFTGVFVGNIGAGSSSTVVFKVTVDTVPLGGTIPNDSTVNYLFTVDPQVPNGAVGSGNSNTLNTPVKQATIDYVNGGGFTKSGDPGYVQIGDVITYTIGLKNTGNVAANNVVFTDTTPAGTDFIANTVTVNGIVQPGISPQPPTGVPVGTINPNVISTITFKVRVNSIPITGTIPNTGTTRFTYIVDPSLPPVNGSGNTNKVDTGVNEAIIDNKVGGGFVKSVSPKFAVIGDTLTYTIGMKNTGNTAANNVFFSDTIPTGTTFVPNSVTLNAVPQPGTNPNPPSSIPVGTINAGASSTVTFQVVVNTIPVTGTIPNDSTVKFTFTKDPGIPNGANGSGNTNRVNTGINQAIIGGPTIPNNSFVKLADKAYADIGDFVTYTILAKNTGNTAANNVVVTDAIPNGAVYESGTLTVDGVANPSNPNIGISIGTINSGQTKTIVFKVKVVAIPIPDPMSNIARVTYQYTVDPSIPNGAVGTGITAPVDTKVNHGVILPQDAVKTSNRVQTTEGDVITYTITAKNTGNVQIDNVIVLDTIIAPTTFVNGSVLVNGVSDPGANPNTGINVGIIGVNQTSTVTFDVKTTATIPSNVVNKASINYKYVVDPAQPEKSASTPTNTITIPNLYHNIVATKSSDRVGAIVGNSIVYTVTLVNDGQIDLTNVVVKDLLNPSLQYTNNLTINGVPTVGDITFGVNIGPILVGQIVVVKFTAQVLSVPVGGDLTNQSTVDYQYTLPGAPTESASDVSNVNHVKIYQPSIVFNKVSNKISVKVGDTFNYTVTATNNGDIAITNAVVKDTLPASIIVTQVTVNGVITPGNIALGIPIGPIAVGETKIVVITVKVIAPLSGKYFNIIDGAFSIVPDPKFPPEVIQKTATDPKGVTVYNPQLTITKSADKSYAVVGDTVTYSIVAKNTGDLLLNGIKLDNVTILDILSSELEFIAGSVTIDGIEYPNETIISGVNIGTLQIGEYKTITFKAKVVAPSDTPIVNTVIGNYSFTLPDTPPQQATATSNAFTLIIKVAHIAVKKVADKTSVFIGETVTYTVNVINDGDVDALNVIFKDVLPKGLTLIDGTFTVDGIVINGVEPTIGVNIGNIPAGTRKVVSYKVKVKGSACGCSGYLTNSASAIFKYLLPDRSIGSIQSDPSSVTISVALSTFRQISIEEKLQIPPQKPCIESINDVKGEIEILNCHIIQTQEATSREGQHLTGYKLVVHGRLKQVVEYTANEPTQPVHSAHFNTPFSNFIMLPEDYIIGSKVDVEGIVEDIYSNVIDERCFFSNATVIITAKILCC